jgi:hypothetical protein
VTVRPQRPEQLNIRARRNIGVQSSGLGTWLAARSVATALQVRKRDVLNGAVALDGPRDTRDWGVGVRVGVGLVESVGCAGDEGGVDVAVAKGGWEEGGQGEGREEGGLHDGVCVDERDLEKRWSVCREVLKDINV